MLLLMIEWNTLLTHKFIQQQDMRQPIYYLQDTMFRIVFQFLTFRELFQTVSMVCKWWRNILFRSIHTVDIVYVNKNVFFGPIPVKIDRIEELVGLSQLFVAQTVFGGSCCLFYSVNLLLVSCTWHTVLSM